MKEVKTKEELEIKVKELEAKIAELENTESKSSACLENSPVCTKVVDLDFNLQYMSNAGVSALQVEDVSALYGKPYPLSFFPEAYNKTMRENLLLAKQTGESIIQEGEVLDIKGNALWFEASITPVYNKQGEMDHLLVVSIDTLARKKAEDELLKSEKKYRELVNLAQEGIWVIDKHNTTSFANPSMAKMLGYSSEEMLGKSLFYFMDETGVKIAQKNLERRQAGFKEQHDFEFICKNGNRIITSMETAPIMDHAGNYEGAIAGVMDITERKQAEQLIQQNKNRLDYALKSIKTGAWELNLNTLESWRTFKHDQIFGYNEPLDEWTYDMFLEHVISEDREMVNQKFQHAIENKTDWNFECRIKRNNDDEIRWIWANGNHEIKENEDSLKMFGIVQDITQKKQTEQDLFDSQNNMLAVFNNTQDAQLLSKYIGENDFIIIAANKSYLEKINKFGLKITEEDIVGISLKELILDKLNLGQDVYDYTISFYLKVIETQNQINHNESFVLNKDNYYSETSYTPIFNSQNGMSFILYNSHDITEKRLAEEELVESMEQLSLALEGANAGLWSWNIKTGEDLLDERWCAILGYTKAEIKQHVSSWEALMHPDDKDRTMAAIQKHFETENSEFKQEYRMKCKNGQWKWIFAAGKIVKRDSNGEPAQMKGIIIDIAKQKKAEEKRRAAEENLKNTFDLSPSIIAKANMKIGRFIQVNITITKILGYTIEEFTSKPYMEFVHPDDRQSTIDIATEQLKGNEVTFFENRYLCKDGTYKWMAWHGTKPDKNGIVTTIGSDINERKTIEQEIIKTKQFYENVIEGVQDGIWVTDKNDVIYYANSAMEKIAGVSREQIQGNNILKDFPNETTGELIKFYKQAKKEKIPVWYNIKVRTLGKRDTWQNGWLIPQYQNETFIGIICTIRDVTERKKAELELIASKEKAEESDKLKSAFLANMSHEIRTPMNGILGFINLLNEPDLSQVEIEAYSAVINRSGKRLLTTINDIIDISRIESGEMIIIKEATSINNMMDEIYSFHSPEVKQKGLSLILKPLTENLETKTDSHKLHGILTNLIKNAIKFTEKGSITFGCILKKDIKANKQGKSNFLEFFVEDTGIGIPKDRIQAVFRRFERADIVDIMAFEGSGLGLAISKAYVEMLGGKMHVESEVENLPNGKARGSKFIFTLPY